MSNTFQSDGISSYWNLEKNHIDHLENNVFFWGVTTGFGVSRKGSWDEENEDPVNFERENLETWSGNEELDLWTKYGTWRKMRDFFGMGQ